MSWGLFFRIRQTLKGSLWVLPLVGGFVGVALSNASVWLEHVAFVPHGWDYSTETASDGIDDRGRGDGRADRVRRHGERARRPDGDRDVLGAVHAALVPRQRPQGDACRSDAARSRSRTRSCAGSTRSVPDLGVTMAGFLLGLGLVLFLVFLDRFVHRLRPVKVAELVARSGREALRATVELASTRRRSGADAELEEILARQPALVVRSQAVRCRPGDRRRGSARLGDPPRRGHRDAARRRGLRLLRRAAARGARDGAVPGDRRATSRRQVRARDRANDRPGSGLRAPDSRRRRDQSAVAGRQRSDDGGPGASTTSRTRSALIGRTPGLDGRWEYRDDARQRSGS